MRRVVAAFLAALVAGVSDAHASPIVDQEQTAVDPLLCFDQPERDARLGRQDSPPRFLAEVRVPVTCGNNSLTIEIWNAGFLGTPVEGALLTRPSGSHSRESSCRPLRRTIAMISANRVP